MRCFERILEYAAWILIACAMLLSFAYQSDRDTILTLSFVARILVILIVFVLAMTKIIVRRAL